MHKCNYEDRLEFNGDQFIRIVKAICVATKKHGRLELDVYREYEDGYIECRNLYTSLYGYRVCFPEEMNTYYGCIEYEQEWGECKKITAFGSNYLTDTERAMILREYPNFQYIMKKWKGTLEQTLSVLDIWKKHPDIEFALALGFERIAMSKRFWALNEKRRKEVALFMRKHPNCKDMSIVDVLAILANKYDVDEYRMYLLDCHLLGHMSFAQYEYIQTQENCGLGYYWDYLNLLKQTEHDMNNKYWKYPKDLRKAHSKIADEVERAKALRDAEQLKVKQADFKKAVKKYLKHNAEVDGYRIYVPDDVLDVQKQAVELHQCLVSCDYIGKVIDKKCVLVFVRKDDVPIATAEILPDWSIGQFYANELDQFDCLPTDEVRGAVDKWLRMCA